MEKLKRIITISGMIVVAIMFYPVIVYLVAILIALAITCPDYGDIG